MADVHEPSVRSYNMSRVKGSDTKPEIRVRKALHAAGFRFTLHGKYKGKKLPGKPDIVLPAYRSVIFVHGCFWHAHEGCKYFKLPDTRTEFWQNKLYGNRERDKKNEASLSESGWNVLTVWTCELKTIERAELSISRLKTKLLSLKPE